MATANSCELHLPTHIITRCRSPTAQVGGGLPAIIELVSYSVAPEPEHWPSAVQVYTGCN